MEVAVKNRSEKIHKLSSVHTSRTMMFAEISKLMEVSAGTNREFENLLEENVIAKQTQKNKSATSKYLKKLYLLDNSQVMFRMFRYFWNITPTNQKPLLAFQFALTNDFLLSESIDTIRSIPPSQKVTIEKLEENIELHHPNRYSNKTLHSTAQNIASSWKQIGIIEGKSKNLRMKITPTFQIATFAAWLSYHEGMRGDFILKSKFIRTLDCSEEQVKSLFSEAARNDLMEFHYAGGVFSIGFKKLQKIIAHEQS